MANAWVIDARSYDASTDLKKSTLFQSEAIKEFLEAPQSAGAVVIAPKGCGKTLLIKHKRKLMEAEDYLLLPHGQMVDVNPGTASQFSNEDLHAIESTPDFWSQLWQISICISVLRAVENKQALEPLLDVDPMLVNGSLETTFELFEHLLKTQIKSFSRLYDVFRTHVRPAYRQDHGTRVAVFIDNIDEFFSPHLQYTTKAEHGIARDRFYGQLSRSFWDSAQVGFLLAARALKALNPHIKVFGAIRSEALNSFSASVPELVNARALLVDLDYGYEELREIFE
ncbi:MAG: hypothetical protein AAGA69_10885, partial [Pseudomonadota bacterium]